MGPVYVAPADAAQTAPPVVDAAPTPVVDESAPIELEVPAKPTGGQAAIAYEFNQAGIEEFNAKQFEAASAKFRNAAARVPEPAYFINACISMFREGKLGEALTACEAAEKSSSATAQQRTKALTMISRIKAREQRR